MPVFGVVVDYENGASDFVVATGATQDIAVANVRDSLAGKAVSCVEAYNLDDMVDEQYDGVAFLTSESGC